MDQHLDSTILDAYAEEALPWQARQVAEDHLQGCELCWQRLAYHRHLTALAARLPVEPVPPLFRLRVKNAVLLAIARRERLQAYRRRIGYFVLACSLAGVALIASSWTQLVSLVNALAATPPFLTLEALLTWMMTSSLDSYAGLVNAGLNWQTGLEEGVDVALLLGLVLLCLAAIGALARLLASGDLTAERFNHLEGELE